MKHLKTILFATVFFLSVTIPVFADEVQPSVAPIEQFTAADMQLLFEQDTQPMQLAVLSQEEMRETEGAQIKCVTTIINVLRNTKFDGYNARTGRIFQVRYKEIPVFRLDYAPNPSPTKLHMHFGPNMKEHRPWYAPWRTY